MAVHGYITLNGTGFTEKRFRVLSQGHRPAIEKKSTVRITVTGHADVQSAPVLDRFKYLLKVYETDPDGTAYGTKADLEAFFRAGTPPDNVLTLVETDDTKTHDVVFVGRLIFENKSPVLSGSNAIFWAQVEMVAV
jgi:hypothetical protein